MRWLAQYVMRGPTQAAAIALLATAVPLLFWIGAAVIGLVTLRVGLIQGLQVALLALLPGAYWAWTAQESISLMAVIMAWPLAALLRQARSWEMALLLAAGLALLGGVVSAMLMAGMIDALSGVLQGFYQQHYPDLVAQLGADFAPYMTASVIASLGGSYQVSALGSLMLARSWQAGLDNPGGFRREFREIRLSPRLAILVVVALAASSQMGQYQLLVAVCAGMMAVFAGIALVHGLVAQRSAGTQWLVIFYAVLFVFGPGAWLFVMLLAIVDSWLDFRSRKKVV